MKETGYEGSQMRELVQRERTDSRGTLSPSPVTMCVCKVGVAVAMWARDRCELSLVPDLALG